MRWRVQLQQQTPSRDAYGQEVKTWSTITTVWAEIWSVAGREAKNADQEKGEVSHKLTIRWLGESTTITPKMRFLFKSRVLNIVWVNNPDMRNRWYEIDCQEVQSPP